MASKITQLINFEATMNENFYSVIYKEIVTDSLVVKNITAVTSAVLFRFQSKSSGFHANEPSLNTILAN